MDTNSNSNGNGNGNGEFAFGRRLSPRLHSDSDYNAKRNSPVLHTPPLTPITIISSPSHKKDSSPNYSGEEFQRRVSPRLHRDSSSAKDTEMKPDASRRFSPRLHKPKPVSAPPATPKRLYNNSSCANANANADTSDAKRSRGHHSVTAISKKAIIDAAASPVATRSVYERVKETLRIFNTYYLQFLEVEDGNGPGLKALTKMKEKKEILYPEKRFGHIPGIDVGYKFYSRAEMVAIGFHKHWLKGIDYIGTYDCKKMPKEYQHYTFPIATSIVLSGQYEDNQDFSEDIIYTGEGGNDLVGGKLQCADQVMVRGNLALKNSIANCVPVRVVRKHVNIKSYPPIVYSYDGLYKVIEVRGEKGKRGYLVYKFRLKRVEGQPKLSSDQVGFVRDVSDPSDDNPGLICSDLSNGEEEYPIPVFNSVDNTTIPNQFKYIKTMQVAVGVNLPPNVAGCLCKGQCTKAKKCDCAKANGFEFPYVRRNGGRLIEAKDVVIECGPNCGCGPQCINRVSQRGIKYHLEVYRTPDKGWAVRSRDFIPEGAPVCEYIGMLRRNDDLNKIVENEFIFEIDCWHTMKEIEGRERRYGNVSVPATSVPKETDLKDVEPEFGIDAGSMGNVARFINHSCEPNLFIQCVLSSHRDLRLARLVLFAADPIRPMQELTYDYAYTLDSVSGPDGQIKQLPCLCGTSECRKRLY